MPWLGSPARMYSTSHSVNFRGSRERLAARTDSALATERPVSARSARRLATTPGAAALPSLGFGITLPAILLEYPRHPPNTDEDSLLLEDTCRASLDTASYLFYVERCGVH